MASRGTASISPGYCSTSSRRTATHRRSSRRSCSASTRTSCGAWLRSSARSLQLIQLVGVEPEYAALLTDEGLEAYRRVRGRHRTELRAARCSAAARRPAEPRPGAVVAAARRAGLLLHPYTFRRDDLPSYVPDLEEPS